MKAKEFNKTKDELLNKLKDDVKGKNGKAQQVGTILGLGISSVITAISAISLLKKAPVLFLVGGVVTAVATVGCKIAKKKQNKVDFDFTK